MTKVTEITNDRIRINVNMVDEPGDLTWNVSGETIKIKLMNTDVDLSLDLGPEVVRQLKQALSWTK